MDFVKKAYQAYFGFKLGHQDKPFAPHSSRNKKRNSMLFGAPMVWRKGTDHITDCYFCMANLKDINRKNKHHVQYLDVPFPIKPVPHSPDLLFPKLNVTMESSSYSESSDMTDTAECGTYPARGGRPTGAFDPSRTKLPYARPEPFQGVGTVTGFSSSREMSTGTLNNILLVSGMNERI